ncbi:FKBP-type peptidyl-prolyl cis-trans isomerase [Roseofilum casamattae]|uniref:Peptidyl-prolyl cis-trans isomerase n=1 Tax=Roseofilum casamattae BLCC-M143 TaxID=3022442 RepID=A0ABT7C1B2_9CYAN|nr:FKBP-type peptidyl-prolyl cis-trans isomerase [Roseofilum casamattae]MDJ1185250.1 FKBP-type peptidyl-prolyl cis-trans isomerase [Roseofilum casamattae BLCC-M143]
MKEIWITFGVMVACALVLVGTQLFGSPSAANAGKVSEVLSEVSAPEIANIIPEGGKELMANAESESDKLSAVEMTETPSGLKYTDLVVGEGDSPQKGDRVEVHYVGTLENGSKFDSSRDRGQPFVFQIGVGQVIQGWDEGVASMKVGGKRKLVVPPALGYGSRGIGPIPGNSTLIFEVELLGIK